MRKLNFQLSTINFQLIILLLITSCTRNYDYMRPQNMQAPDSLWILTGDTDMDGLLQDAITNFQIDDLQNFHDGIMYDYGSTDTEKAKDYCMRLKNLSEYLDWNTGRYLYASGFSDILISVNQNDSALAFLQQALEFAEKEENETWKASVYLSMANAYINKNWNHTALTYMMQALHYFEEINSHYLPYIYCNMGVLYRNINLVEKAIEFGKKAVDLDHENPYYLSELGTSYIYQHQYEESTRYLEEALRHSIENNYIYLSGYIYTNLGNNALLTFDLDKAEMCARKSLEISQSSANIINHCANYILLGKVELSRGHFVQSEAYIKEALKIAEDVEDLSLTKFCYVILSELSVVQHKFRENVQYRSKWESLGSIMETKTAVIAAAEMSAKYETAKKELEIERQQQVIARQKVLRTLLVAGIVISIVFLALMWHMLQLRTRRNRVLADLNATKDKFFSIISHDLKSPAITQRNAIQLLLDNASLWNTDTMQTYFRGLLKSADSQVDLLYNLLNWAQVQTGQTPCRPTIFDLAAELGKSEVVLLSSMAARKNISLIISVPDNTFVTGDVNMLITVVRNLLTNAIKFTAAGGTVALDVSPGKNATHRASIVISITDTGTGMNEEQIRNLFNIDRQCSVHGTAGESGAGLGLVVCRELLEKHGSTLHVESEEGKGSKFWFELKS